MGVPRFHVEMLSVGITRPDDHEAAHAVKSRRLSVGATVALFDGIGHEAFGRIVTAGKSRLEVEVGEVRTVPRPRPALTLAVALPKGPRQETLIEKCTELGTAGIVPLLTARSVSSASEHKRERWQRTAIEAAKQSGQAWLPDLHAPEPLDEAIRRIAEHDLAVVAFPGGEKVPAVSAGRLIAFVGPEGGWTEEEIRQLLAAGCRPVSLGPNILRIETAAIALAAWIHTMQS